jgi:hypothetical protein
VKSGDKGSEVLQLQRALAAVGLTVTADGWYGDQTVAAVAAFQKRVGLVADGEAGPKTLAALQNGAVDPRHLGHDDLAEAATRLGVPVAAIMAVNNVESQGKGFLADGRPVILFERHQLYRLLVAAGADADALAVRYPALINPKRGGYAGGAAEWSRFSSATQITADYPMLAAQACSWGQFQIMGYHWQHLGYDNPEAFFSAMHNGEAGQLDAFIRFIEAEPALHKALKARKWADFARLYNGPAYKENLYDVKLARAFEKFSDAPEAVEA